MSDLEESYHRAMETLVIGDHQYYAPNATTRTDYPTMTVQGEAGYSTENHEIYFESIGPGGGGPYSLVFELSEKQVKHTHGAYEHQQAAGLVNDIRFPNG